ncbi:hypothetical protein [Rhodococcus opacus]|uniref:hypothetical protein n=1 Tax=Rhodococcus opacus TaxID=37919 RepID=UPI003CD01E77
MFGGRGRIVFDGEIVALAPAVVRAIAVADEHPAPDRCPAAAGAGHLPSRSTPSADGGDLMAAPYLDRRVALTNLGHEHWEGVNGAVILEAARDSGGFQRVGLPSIPLPDYGGWAA